MARARRIADMTEAPNQGAIFDYLHLVFERAIQLNLEAFMVASYLQNDKWLSKSFTLGELEAASRWLAEKNEFANVYYRVNLLGAPLASEFERGKFKDNAYVTHFAFDIDYGTSGHASKNLVPTVEAATEILLKTLPPTKILHSGGGVYGVYLLNEPFDVRRSEDNERAKAIGQAIEKALGKFGEVDSINSGAHVIRPKGSLNRKREKLFEVCEIAGTNQRFTIEQLEKTFQVEKPSSAEKELLGETSNEWKPTKVGAIFNAEPKNTWLEILEADKKLKWRHVGRNQKGQEVFACEGSSTGKSATIENGRFYVHSTTVAERLGVKGGARLDKFGLAARLLGEDPKELSQRLLQ
jgi:hypothetical protein